MRNVLRILVLVVGLLAVSTASAEAQVTNFDLRVQVSRSQELPPLPGDQGSYVVTVSNDGPGPTTGEFGLGFIVAIVSSDGTVIVPAQSWTCEPAPGLDCPNQYRPIALGEDADQAQVTGSFPPFSQMRLTVRFDVPEGVTGGYVFRAAVSYPAGVQDRNPANDASAWNYQPFEPRADLGITVDNGRDTYVPGQPTTYTVVASNHGPHDIVQAEVGAPQSPPETTWTCVPGPGAACSPSGTGPLHDLADIPAGGSVTYSVTFVPQGIPPNDVDFLYGVAINPPVAHGQITVQLPDGTSFTADTSITWHDFHPGNNLDVDYDFLPAEAGQADIGVTIDNGRDQLGTSEVVTYTVVLRNDGPASSTGNFGVILIPFELGSITFTCEGAGGAVCARASGAGVPAVPGDPSPFSGQVVGDADLTLPPGSSLTYRITGTITGGGALPQTTINAIYGSLTTPNGGNRNDDLGIDTDPIVPAADLGVTITDGVTSVLPGATTTYTLVVTNDGPDTARNVSVDHALPAAIPDAKWTCVATGGAVCSAMGPGGVRQRGLTMPAGSTLTYTVTGTVAADAVGSITTTASVSAPEPVLPNYPGSIDADATNNTASDTDALPAPDLGVAVVVPPAALPGSTIPIEVTVTNGGTAPAAAASLSLPLPAGTTFVSAQQTTGPAATLDAPAVGSGTGTVTASCAPSLAAGASATFVVRVAIGSGVAVGTEVVATATVATTTTEFGDLANTATGRTLVVPPVVATISPTSVRVDEGQDATVTVQFSPATAVPAELSWTAIDGVDAIKFRALGGQLPVADYVAGPRTVLVPAGTATMTLAVPTLNDGRDEPDESFRIQLTGATGPQITIGSPATATVLIRGQRSGTPTNPPVFPPVAPVRPG